MGLLYKLLRFVLIFSSFFVCLISQHVFASPFLTNALAKNIGKTYGFHMGQNFSLDQISEKYPSLNGLSLIAQKEFSSSFGRSLKNMDDLMSKYDVDRWGKIKANLRKQISTAINIDNVSEAQARLFIETVRLRAKGKIKSPMIETLLMFNQTYEQQPEREFLDGYKKRFLSDGNGKSKGIVFHIDYPQSWASKEGNRPNIVRKFVSESGNGLEIILVQINDLPLEQAEQISQEDIQEILNKKDISELFLPKNAKFKNSGLLTVENQPGFWVRFSMQAERVRTTIEMEGIVYIFFYKDKMIQVHGQVGELLSAKKQINFSKFEKLFDHVVNTFVIENLYK